MKTDNGGDCMTIYVKETWDLKPEKAAEFIKFLERWKKLVKERPELFEGLKSWNSYEAVMGTTFQGMNLWEYENMAEMEKSSSKFYTDPTLVKLVTELWTYLIPGTHREEVWKPVMKIK
jgi:hypothetical protein